MNEYIAKLVQEMIWKPEPLSEQECLEFENDWQWGDKYPSITAVIRAIEQRHGIK
jgi:hypothetical protein